MGFDSSLSRFWLTSQALRESTSVFGGGFVGGFVYSHIIQCRVTEDFQWILGPKVAGSVETALVRGVRAGALGFGSLTERDGIRISM